MSNLAIYLDCETTGLDPNAHGLIEFTAAILNPAANFAEVDRYKSRQIQILPGSCEVSEGALKVNGYSAATLHLGRKANVVAREFADFLARYNNREPFHLIGQNVSFDEGFMKKFAYANGHPYESWFSHRKIDVGAFLNARNLIEGKKGSSLKDACKEWGVIHENAHTSDGDVSAGVEVMKRIFATVNFAAMVPPSDTIEKEKEVPAEIAYAPKTGLPVKKKARDGENPNP